MALPTGLCAALDEAAAPALAARLVAIPSHPGIPRQEEAAALGLAGYLQAAGLAPTLDEAAPGRPNLLCSLAGERAGPTLLLCGHTDTVPPNATGDRPGDREADRLPDGSIADGRLWGRGAVDMKGPLAAMAAALAALHRSGLWRRGTLTLAAVVDEEMESLGAERLVASGLAAGGAIVGEPTANRLCLGHRGLEWLEVVFGGRAAHGGTPEAGINAIVAAARFVALVEAKLAPRLASRRHPLLGSPTLNLGTIAGGDQPSTVAAACRLTADRRLVPGESYESAVAELEGLLDLLRAELPGLTTAIGRMAGGMATMEHGPLLTDSGDPVARACRFARREVLGEEAAAEPDGAFPAWSDGALLAAYSGIPTVILGPGDLALAHAPRESIPVAEIETAARLYAAAALAFCGEPPA